MASCSATPAGPGTIKNGPVPAEDAATYQYLGYTVPRQNIDDKFGSYWGTALGLATGPASIAATTILLCALSGWQPVILGSGGAFCFFISSLCILDAPTKLIAEQYGETIAKLYGLFVFGFYASYSTWLVLLFLHPVNGQVLWTTLLMALQNLLASYSMVGSEISLQEPNWRRLRFNRQFLMAAAWLEFGTDFASGVIACQNGLPWLGSLVLAASVGEYGLIVMHTSSGITEYSLRFLGFHAMLEGLVLAVTICIILAQRNGPFSYQLPQIISIAQTVTGLTLHAIWLLYKRRTNPRFPAKGATVAPDPVQQENTAIEEVVSAK